MRILLTIFDSLPLLYFTFEKGDRFAANVIALAAAVADGGLGVSSPSAGVLVVRASIDAPPQIKRRHRERVDAVTLPTFTPSPPPSSPQAAAEAREAAGAQAAAAAAEEETARAFAAAAAAAAAPTAGEDSNAVATRLFAGADAAAAAPSALPVSTEMSLFAQRLQEIERLTESLEGEFSRSFFELEHASAARLRAAEAREKAALDARGVEGMLSELEASVGAARVSVAASEAAPARRRGRRRAKPRARRSKTAGGGAPKSPLQRRALNRG